MKNQLEQQFDGRVLRLWIAKTASGPKRVWAESAADALKRKGVVSVRAGTEMDALTSQK